MPKRKVSETAKESFGDRLARLRKAAGFSQRELAAELGISPAHLLPQLANALGVSIDELLGVEQVKRNGRVRDTRLWRRFSQVEKLPPAERKPIVQVIDTFLKGERAGNE